MQQMVLSCLYSGRSNPSPTLNPANSSSPFLVTPSMARRMKKPIIAALLFIRSALSTNPNIGFFNDGCLGGMVTPFGGVVLVAQTTAAFLLPFDSFHRFATAFPVLLTFELHLLLARIGKETHAHVASIFFRRVVQRGTGICRASRARRTTRRKKMDATCACVSFPILASRRCRCVRNGAVGWCRVGTSTTRNTD